MDSTYSALAEFAQTWGLLLFIAAFAVAVLYALWPSNKKKFDDAARAPLREDD
jgi:cytochrome c oxidase cbb3-type subunit IV